LSIIVKVFNSRGIFLVALISAYLFDQKIYLIGNYLLILFHSN
jgi:multidrug transporter EmrE-like cation transporter